jgi:hypothetical protein
MVKKAIFLNLLLENLGVGMAFNKLSSNSTISLDIFSIYDPDIVEL